MYTIYVYIYIYINRRHTGEEAPQPEEPGSEEREGGGICGELQQRSGGQMEGLK